MVGTLICLPVRVGAARDVARHLLAGRPERWRHTLGVARRARELTRVIGGEDPDVLLAAAWLHDIGYAPDLRDTGFHPLDGARYLDRHGWAGRVAGLVAHHSGACYVAAARGLSEALDRWPREEGPLADALTYADQTVGPDGRRMSVECRIREMLERHGPDSPNARVHARRGPYLLGVAGRVRARLRAGADPRAGGAGWTA